MRPQGLFEGLRCASCGGDLQMGTTTHIVDFGTRAAIVRNVPVAVCIRCGDEWLDGVTAAALDTLAHEVQRRVEEFLVLSYDDLVAGTSGRHPQVGDATARDLPNGTGPASWPDPIAGSRLFSRLYGRANRVA
jgi:YgiT-type zinc finger domain-containing protein